jgi:hypothetical protein
LLQREWEEMKGNICRIKFYYFRKNTITVQDNRTNKEKTHTLGKRAKCDKHHKNRKVEAEMAELDTI